MNVSHTLSALTPTSILTNILAVLVLHTRVIDSSYPKCSNSQSIGQRILHRVTYLRIYLELKMTNCVLSLILVDVCSLRFSAPLTNQRNPTHK